jgi:hypothetical protein
MDAATGTPEWISDTIDDVLGGVRVVNTLC